MTFRKPFGRTSPGLKHAISGYLVPLSNSFSFITNLWPSMSRISCVPSQSRLIVLEQQSEKIYTGIFYVTCKDRWKKFVQIDHLIQDRTVRHLYRSPGHNNLENDPDCHSSKTLFFPVCEYRHYHHTY